MESKCHRGRRHRERWAFLDDRRKHRWTKGTQSACRTSGKKWIIAQCSQTWSAWWDFEPEKIVGIYLYPGPNTEITFLRICFSGSSFQHYPDQKLDEEIVQALWMSRKELDQRKENLRSPLVTNCIDDYLKGQKYSLDLLHHYEAWFTSDSTSNFNRPACLNRVS